MGPTSEIAPVTDPTPDPTLSWTLDDLFACAQQTDGELVYLTMHKQTLAYLHRLLRAAPGDLIMICGTSSTNLPVFLNPHVPVGKLRVLLRGNKVVGWDPQTRSLLSSSFKR